MSNRTNSVSLKRSALNVVAPFIVQLSGNQSFNNKSIKTHDGNNAVRVDGRSEGLHKATQPPEFTRRKVKDSPVNKKQVYGPRSKETSGLSSGKSSQRRGGNQLSKVINRDAQSNCSRRNDIRRGVGAGVDIEETTESNSSTPVVKEVNRYQQLKDGCEILSQHVIQYKELASDFLNFSDNATQNGSSAASVEVHERRKRFISGIFDAYDSLTSAVVDESKLINGFANKIIPILYNATVTLNTTVADAMGKGIKIGRKTLKGGMNELNEVAVNIESMVENATEVFYGLVKKFQSDFKKAESEISNTTQSVFKAAKDGESTLKTLLRINASFVVAAALIGILGTVACQVNKKRGGRGKRFELSFSTDKLDKGTSAFLNVLRTMIMDISDGNDIKYKILQNNNTHTISIMPESPVYDLLLEEMAKMGKSHEMTSFASNTTDTNSDSGVVAEQQALNVWRPRGGGSSSANNIHSDKLEGVIIHKVTSV